MTGSIAAIAFLLAAATAADIDHAIDSGRLDQARLMIAQTISEAGTPAALEPQLARLAFQARAFDEALARYQKLWSADPTNTFLAERVGLSALALGKDDLALSALTRAALSPSASWRTWNALGVIADRSEEFGEARENYRRALLLEPGKAEILNNLGWSYFLEGDAGTAIPLLEKAAAADPSSRLFADNLELARAALSDRLPVRRVSESDGDYAARLNDAGVIAISRHQNKRAIAAFAQAVSARGEWYERAANNLKVAEGRK